MALIKCPECGKEVSDKAPSCIHCGYPLGEASSATEELPTIQSLMEEKRKAQQAKLQESLGGTTPKCPKCGSQSIQLMKKGFGLGKAAAGGLLLGPVGLLGGAIGSNKVQRVCANCGHKF